MKYNNPSMSMYNTDKIIEMLDEKYSSLTQLKVSILTGNENKRFTMNLIKKLYDCGCQVTIISSTLHYFSMRNVIDNSDVCLCFFENFEINGTIHPNAKTVIYDITGKSCTAEFLDTADKNNYYEVYTSGTY